MEKKRTFKCNGCGEDSCCFLQRKELKSDILVDHLRCVFDETNRASYNWVEIKDDIVSNIVKNQKQLDTKIVETVNENFAELLGDWMEEIKPPPNNCEIKFLCDDEYKDCYQFKDSCGTYECDNADNIIGHDGIDSYCNSKICQVNKAILFLKENLGEENLRNHIKSELGL